MKAIIITIVATLLAGVGVVIAANNNNDYQVFSLFPKTTTKTEVANEPVGFAEDHQNDPNLPNGQVEVRREGKEGVRMVTYEITTKGKKEMDRKVVSNVIPTQPINRLVITGTYVPQARAAAPVQSASRSTPKDNSDDYRLKSFLYTSPSGNGTCFYSSISVNCF